MAPLQQAIHLVTFLLIVVPGAMCSEQCYCISSQEYNATFDCPSSCSNCYNVTDILEKPNLFLSSNTTLIFLPGNHSLPQRMYISNISDLKIAGLVHSKIICSNVSMSFSFVSNLLVTSLEFDSCAVNISSSTATFNHTSFANSCGYAGGAIAAYNSSITFTGLTTFTGNVAIGAGGAMYSNNSTLLFSGQTKFESNQVGGDGGGGLFLEESFANFDGETSFVRNEAIHMTSCQSLLNVTPQSDNKTNSRGGGMYLNQSSATFNGYTQFSMNWAIHGGGVYADSTSTQQINTIEFHGNTTFFNNSATTGGAIHVGEFINVSFHGVSTLEYNTAQYMGGAVCVNRGSALVFQGLNTFDSNYGRRGGALFLEQDSVLHLDGDSNFFRNKGQFGGAITGWSRSFLNMNGSIVLMYNRALVGAALCVFQQSALNVSGNIRICRNKAVYFGGGIAVRDSTAHFDGHTEFSTNTAENGGGIYAENGKIVLKQAGVFSSNSAENQNHNGDGGAILASNAVIDFEGKDWIIVNNSARYGGGIAFTGIDSRTLFLSSHTSILFEANTAHDRGGALFVETNPYTYCPVEQQQYVEECFLQHLTYDCYAVFPQSNHYAPLDDIHLVFVNNTAGTIGNTLHGGALETCGYCSGNAGAYYYSGVEVFNWVANISSSAGPAGRDITSDPFKICICEQSEPNCSQSSIVWKVFPYQTVPVTVAALGQMNALAPSVVEAVVSSGLKVNQSQIVKYVGAECKQLMYTLIPVNLSTTTNGTLKLYADEPCSTTGFALEAIVEFLPCPVGFTASEDGQCVCEHRLAEYVTECNVFDRTFTHSEGSNYWVGFENSTSSIILHPRCPFDYCTRQEVRFTLFNTDLQCQNSRSGIICGKCQNGLSRVFGSSRCLSCSNSYIALVIPFALAGIALVLLLFFLQLTVSTGKINALVFYANILAINRRHFFSLNDTNILTVFIAWINLDLGIETCFFDGLDTYSWTWLQFIFPIYIWLLVGLVTLLATYSSTVSKAISNTNPVSVFATLFLLSYTKLLRTTCAVVLSFTFVDYPHGNHIVWLYDGNIDYLGAKHLPLFICCIFLVIIIKLPFCLLLFSGQWIRKKVHLKLLSRRNILRLKSFLDAYHAPYKVQHGYWVGLLLFIRVFVLFLGAVMAPEDVHAILLVMLVILVALMWPIARGIYKESYLNILEISFVINLLVLIGGTYHNMISSGNQEALVYVSISVAFVTFIGIVLYSLSQNKTLRMWFYKTRRRSTQSGLHRATKTLAQGSTYDHNGDRNVPLTYVTLNRELDQAFGHQDTPIQLREPLLEEGVI